MEKNTDKYKGFKFDGIKWYTYWVCKQCSEKIKISASEKYYLLRNLKKKNICKKCSLENQKGCGNPFYSKKHSKETKAKISKNKIGISTSDHMSKPEYKELFSKMTKKRWDSGQLDETRNKLSESMKERHRNGELKSFNRSKAEFEIIEFLEKEGVEVIPNFRIDTKIFDIYIPEFNLLIEYNGDYWHCNPEKYDPDYLNHKKNMTAKEIWEYDKNKLYLAKKNKYNIEIIWESDYKKNKNIILEIIKDYGEH